MLCLPILLVIQEAGIPPRADWQVICPRGMAMVAAAHLKCRGDESRRPRNNNWLYNVAATCSTLGLSCLNTIKLISGPGIRRGRSGVLSGQSSRSPGLVSGSREERALDLFFFFFVQRLCSVVF